MIGFTVHGLRRLLAVLTLTGALAQGAVGDLNAVNTAQFPWYSALTQAEPHFDDNIYVSSNAVILMETHDPEDGILSCPYTFVDLYLPDVHCLRTWYADDPSSPQQGLSDIVTASTALNAALAVNGDFYSAQGVTAVRNGTIINSCVSSYDLCVLYEDGSMRTFRAAELPSQDDVNDALDGAWQAWSFGPVLLEEDGSAILNFSDRTIEYLTKDHPRTAIGYYGPGHYCLLTVSGYRSNIPGVTLEDLSSFFSSLGCLCAYNLDGGGSTHIWFHNHERGFPSETRKLADLIYLEDLSAG